MSSARFAMLIPVLVLVACGGPSDDLSPSPPDARTADASAGGGVVSNPLAAEAVEDPELAGGWAGIRVRVSDHELESHRVFDAEIGSPTALGDTGLTLTAEQFLPDFVMDEGEIHNRSSEPHNPAALVAISEAGAADYRGWIFAAMPGIPPYPHPEYRVVLVEGIPAATTPE